MDEGTGYIPRIKKQGTGSGPRLGPLVLRNNGNDCAASTWVNHGLTIVVNQEITSYERYIKWGRLLFTCSRCSDLQYFVNISLHLLRSAYGLFLRCALFMVHFESFLYKVGSTRDRKCIPHGRVSRRPLHHIHNMKWLRAALDCWKLIGHSLSLGLLHPRNWDPTIVAWVGLKLAR